MARLPPARLDRPGRGGAGEAHTRAEAERVEVACGGGIGRTGTALAILAIMSGVAPDGAMTWVRAHYHPRAVETRRQKRWIEDVAASVRA